MCRKGDEENRSKNRAAENYSIEDLHNLYYCLIISVNKSRSVTDRTRSMHGYQKCRNILVGKSQGSRALETPMSRRQNNGKMKLKATQGESVDSIQLASDRFQWMALMNTAENLVVS
jgi:hypothetical protein